MTYCATCGSQLAPTAKFCVGCGTAVQPVQPTASAPRAPAQVPAPPMGQPVAQQTRTASQASPFSAITAGDYVRDALAATALLLSFFMVWQYGAGIAATHIAVLLISLLSLLSLGITYLWRAGVFGPTWSYAKTQDLRLLANVPYVVMVVVYLVIELVGRQEDIFGTVIDSLGLGPAVAFGLAGAVLAAQPRSAELAQGDVARDRRWLRVVVGLAAVVALLTVIQIIEMFVRSPANDVGFVLVSIVMGVASAALLLTIALRVARSVGAWRLTGIGLGIAAAGLGLLSLSPQFLLVDVRFVSWSPSFSLMFWIAFGAAVSAPSVARLMKPEASEAASWLTAVSVVLGLAVAANALMSLVSIIVLIQIATSGLSQFVSYTPWVLAVVFGVVGVVAGLVVRAMGGKDERQGLLLATAYAGLLFVLGLVLVILWSVQPLGVIGPLTVIIGFVIPAALTALLWGPPSVRQHLESLLPPGHTGTAGFAFAGVQQPVAPNVQQPVAPSQFMPAQTEPASGLDAIRADAIRAEAADAATSAARLHAIASTVPQARALVAANPSTDPALLDWLGRLGDSEINAALESRSH